MLEKIHPLADEKKKKGRIRFIHSDGSTRTFCTAVNRLNGNRLSWFDDSAPSVNDDLKWVRSVFRDIRRKAKVLSVEGDF